MDEGGDTAHLDTDEAINVILYQRCGFKVIAEQQVRGRPNWPASV